MAITSDVTISPGAAKITDGYSVPVVAGIANAQQTKMKTDIAVTQAHASNAVTGITQVMAAIKAFFDSDFAINTLKLDNTANINAKIIVTRIKRGNTAASIFLTGTEVFHVEADIEYA